MYEILKYHALTLSRLSISRLKFLPPEYMAIIAIMIFVALVSMGVSSQNYILVDGVRIVNYNLLSLYFLFAPIIMDVYLDKSYESNYHFFCLLLPYSFNKKILTGVLFEVFSCKIVFIIACILVYIPFCLSYDLDFSSLKYLVLGMVLVLSMYVNSCLIIRFLKDLKKEKGFIYYKNYLKLFLFITFLMMTINENYTLINLYEIATIFLLLSFSLFLFVFLVASIFFVNLTFDKV
jgi:hypothetical protein